MEQLCLLGDFMRDAFTTVYGQFGHRPVHTVTPQPMQTKPLGPWVLCDCGTSYRTDRCPTCEPSIRPANLS